MLFTQYIIKAMCKLNDLVLKATFKLPGVFYAVDIQSAHTDKGYFSIILNFMCSFF